MENENGSETVNFVEEVNEVEAGVTNPIEAAGSEVENSENVTQETLAEEPKAVDDYPEQFHVAAVPFVEEELAIFDEEITAIDEDLKKLDEVDNILSLKESEYPVFTLAKNKARFLRMLSWYKGKEEWLDVAPLSGASKLFKQQSKELEGIRSNKLDYEMELETGTLTPSQRSYRKDELKMCKVHEKMAVHLISRMQIKIKSGRR